MVPSSNHGDKGVLNCILKGNRLLTSECPSKPRPRHIQCPASTGAAPLVTTLVPNWVRRVSEVPDQQLDSFSCHGWRRCCSPSPRPAPTAISAPHIPEQESTTALTGVTRMCLAGRGRILTLVLWFLTHGHCASAVKSLPAPTHLATASGEGRAGCTSSADPGREMAGGPCARKGPAKCPLQCSAAAPRDRGAPQGLSTLPAKTVPCPRLHTVTVRLGAGRGPASPGH